MDWDEVIKDFPHLKTYERAMSILVGKCYSGRGRIKRGETGGVSPVKAKYVDVFGARERNRERLGGKERAGGVNAKSRNWKKGKKANGPDGGEGTGT